MKILYDPEVDVLRILLSNAPIAENDEAKPGMIFDYDKDGNVSSNPIPPGRGVSEGKR